MDLIIKSYRFNFLFFIFGFDLTSLTDLIENFESNLVLYSRTALLYFTVF